MKSPSGCTSFDGWFPTPEGALLRPDEEAVVIADVHLGYEWARGAAGDSIPAHSLAEAVAKLERVFVRTDFNVNRLIVAGDLVESPRPCARTAADVSRLEAWLLDRGIKLTVVPGNHDRSLAASPRAPVTTPVLEIAGWTIQHGDRRIKGDRAILGHHHPVLRAGGGAAPCFLIGPSRIILPAFSSNAAGLDLAVAAIPADWKRAALFCYASTGEELLDFGPLATLSARLRSSMKASPD